MFCTSITIVIIITANNRHDRDEVVTHRKPEVHGFQSFGPGVKETWLPHSLVQTSKEADRGESELPRFPRLQTGRIPETPASQCGFQEPPVRKVLRMEPPGMGSHPPPLRPPSGRQPHCHGRQGTVPDSLALKPKAVGGPHHPCVLAPFQWLFYLVVPACLPGLGPG